MRLTGLQWAGVVATVLAGGALLTALGSEWWGGVVPCALCLLERWPYRIVIVLGLLAAVAPRASRVLVGLCGVIMLGSVLLGGLHLGVEEKFWPSPLPECAAPALGGGTMAERLARMPAKPAKPCDEPTFLIPSVPFSMAAMNMLFSGFLGMGLASYAFRRRRVL
jgi:disulfide bond formation protein DsbB